LWQVDALRAAMEAKQRTTMYSWHMRQELGGGNAGAEDVSTSHTAVDDGGGGGTSQRSAADAADADAEGSLSPSPAKRRARAHDPQEDETLYLQLKEVLIKLTEGRCVRVDRGRFYRPC
jgi:hypothetical protein